MRAVQLVSFLMIAACGSNSAGQTDVDASMGSGSGSPDAAMSACKNKVAIVGNGHHNPGTDCMNSCHNHGFTAAGTLYAAAGSQTPVSGATVTIVDAHGATVNAVSQSNGNFYTSTALSYPISVFASSCPSLTPMVAKVTTTAGCNSGGACHGGSQGKIHLP